MPFVRDKLVVTLTFGALLGGGSAIPGCIGGDDNAAPTFDGGGYVPPGDSGVSVPTPDATVPGNDAGVPDAAPPADDAGTPVDAGPPPTLVRFAWFVGGVSSAPSPESSPPQARPLDTDGGVTTPGYDVCIAPHGTGAWVGPLLASSAYAAGLHPFDVTAYVPVTPGRYDARIVPAGSASCTLAGASDAGGVDSGGDGAAGDAGSDGGAGPSGDFTSLPEITAGSAMTAVLVDPADPTASIADLFAFTDDTTTTPGKAKVRFVNVSESDVVTANDGGPDAADDAGVTVTGASFGLGGGILLSSLFTNVTSQTHLDPSAANGYREMAPLSGVDSTLTLPPTGGDLSTALSTDGLNLPAGGVLTAFYASESFDGARAPVLVWCFDGEGSATSSALTKCVHVDVSTDATSSYTRFGDFSADGTDLDVCLKYHSFGTWSGPLLGQAKGEDGASIPAQSLSAYFNVHGDLAYDARFVAAGATDCSVSVADTTYTAFTAAGGGYTSVLLTGYASVPADAGTIPPFDAGPSPILGDAGPQPVSNGLTTLGTSVVAIEDVAFDATRTPSLRLVHLAALHPQPISVQVTSNGVVVVGDDDAPQLAAPQAQTAWDLDEAPYGGFSTRPGPTDPYGYVPMSQGTLQITLESSSWSYDLANEQTTMFAFDGDGTQLLACDDYEEQTFPDDTLYTSCCVVGTDGCAGQLPGIQPLARHGHARQLVRTLRPRRH